MAEPERDFSLNWAYALGQPECTGLLRSCAEDFQVDEVLDYDADGRGQHALLHIRKRHTNTEWVARQLAELAGVPLREVGYAGLKDRHAVTTQYFSVNLAGREEPDWSQLNDDTLELLSVARHGRKLQRGGLRENRFAITVRDLVDCEALETRLQQVRQQGVPNYFGEQRFGRGGHNLKMALQLFASGAVERDRHKRGLYLSAARSWLFNRVLSQRVAEGNWRQALPGEALLQPYSRSALTLRVIGPDIQARIDKGLLQPSAPLWGRGVSSASAEAARVEHDALVGEEVLMHGLEQAGLAQARRALCLKAREFDWRWQGKGVLRLCFTLPPGGYATAVLRELLLAIDGSHQSRA